uniref:Uncharacterized protein n=1 Tax=Laticauda laticaudata TaxID=8630 RepID=A0A8C5SQ40_LATLA
MCFHQNEGTSECLSQALPFFSPSSLLSFGVPVEPACPLLLQIIHSLSATPATFILVFLLNGGLPPPHHQASNSRHHHPSLSAAAAAITSRIIINHHHQPAAAAVQQVSSSHPVIIINIIRTRSGSRETSRPSRMKQESKDEQDQEHEQDEQDELSPGARAGQSRPAGRGALQQSKAPAEGPPLKQTQSEGQGVGWWPCPSARAGTDG